MTAIATNLFNISTPSGETARQSCTRQPVHPKNIRNFRRARHTDRFSDNTRVASIAPGNRTSTHCAERRLNTQSAAPFNPPVNLSHSQMLTPRQSLTSAPSGAKNQYIQQNRQFPQPNATKNRVKTLPLCSHFHPKFAKISATCSHSSESHRFFSGFYP